MDFVKREDPNAVDEENYKMYMENIQKSQMDLEYQHASISMEQLHQAMQSGLNAGALVHNFQLPLSPRHVSSLMLKTNHITRNLNFNDIPAHLSRNLTTELDLVHNLTKELPQNLGRHEDLLGQNLSRSIDVNLARNLGNELDLQNSLTQSLVQNLSEQDLNRINSVSLQQSIRPDEMPHDLNHEIDLSHHLNRSSIAQDLLNPAEARAGTMVPCVQDNILEQNLGQSLAPRLINGLDQNEPMLPIPFHIKSETDDEGYYYDDINAGQWQSLNVNGLNGHIPVHADHQSNPANIPEQIYTYNNHAANIPAINSVDIYARPQNFAQNFIASNIRDNPQNLVVNRHFENTSAYEEFKKLRQDVGQKSEVKNEQPKESLKPSSDKIFYDDYQNVQYNKNTENDSGAHNKLQSAEELSMNIKGEYICYKCNEIFPSKRGLKQHAKTCTETSETDTAEKLGKFSCSQCSYRCQSPAILKIHERTHTGEKPFSCTICTYKSGQKNNVAKHILVHMKEKPFKCQYCEYKCAQKNNLVVHERTHTGVKPFACTYCPYRTVQKPNLVKHLYLHTDQKPYSCDMCSYKCVQKTNLTKHKQRHLNDKTGEKMDISGPKPYRPRQKSVKCPHCPYRCVQKASLEKHLQFKHGDPQTELVQQEFEGLNLMKSNETIQNLSVKRDSEIFDQEKVLEPLQIQS